jgi:hypothetical protein
LGGRTCRRLTRGRPDNDRGRDSKERKLDGHAKPTDHRFRDSYAAHADYGFQLVLVFGLVFTLLIAAIYLPTHLTRTRVADRIRDAYIPALSPDSPEWSSQSAKRDQLAGVLGLGDGPLSQFKTAVPIMTPLIGALVRRSPEARRRIAHSR